MEYDLTPEERQKYIAARGKTIVTACPGSGKTTSIVYKLRQLCDEVEATNKHTGVLCLSFTNKAVDEIRASFKKMHGFDIRYPHDVLTIDSFLTQNIVMPFWYLYKKCKTSPVIVNEEALLRKVLWHHYTKDGKVKEVCNIKNAGKLPYTYLPEFINCCGRKYYHKITEIPAKYCGYAQKVVEYRLANGFLTSSDAMSVALDIVKMYPLVAESIVKRYPYIIVDEAQDTSYDQFCLLANLLNAGLQNLEFVGDINQSIYEWRFARPDILEKLTKKKEWQHIPFINNRRSAQHIIDLYTKLVPIYRRQRVLSTGVINANIPLVVYRYDKQNSQDVISDFESRCISYDLKEWLILTRGRNLGKLLSGTKDTPEYWKTPIPTIILNAYQNFQDGSISKAVQQLAFVWSLYITKENEYEERKIFVKAIMDDSKKSSFLVNVLFQMPNLNESFESWTAKMPKYLQDVFKLDTIPVFETYQRKKKTDIKTLAKSKLSLYYGHGIGSYNSARTIQTIHSSKGASTDAVLLFLSSNNQGKQISLNLFDNSKVMSEKHRMLYVGCSRARQFLAFAVPMDYPIKRIQELFNSTNFELKIPGKLEGLF